MQYESEGLMVVRAELCARLESLQRLSRRVSTRDFNQSLASIRSLANAYGLVPVVRLADALERAIALADPLDPRACPTGLYLARLQDAIGCDRLDDSASEAIIASVSVRFGG